MSWRKLGEDPDYRFSLANERTFLAWIRTALAILAGAIVLHQFAGGLGSRRLLDPLSGALCVLAGSIGGGAYFRWRGNELAMRLKQSLPRAGLIAWLAVLVALLGAGSAFYLLAGGFQ
ncbi:MAG: DUF202 domain-containing protein [Rubrivivax sp.]